MATVGVVTDPGSKRSLDALPELLTRQELAAFTGVSVQTLARWVGEGTGPRITRLGKHAVRYRRLDVISWLDQSAA